MRVMGKPSQQRHVTSVLRLHIDLDFAMSSGPVLRLPDSIQPGKVLEMLTDLSLINFYEDRRCNCNMHRTQRSPK